MKNTYDPNWTTSEYFAWNGKLASRGMAAKAARGEYPSAAPLGYKNVRRNGQSVLRIDPDTAPLIREAFRLRREGRSIRSILRILTEKGLRSRRGNKLTPSAMHRILRSPVYRGRTVWKGDEMPGNHEPLA